MIPSIQAIDHEPSAAQRITLTVDGIGTVSGLFQSPPGAWACFVVAHGAGAGMTHRFLDELSQGLAERRIASLRYQFPFMEQGTKRPDPPSVAHATVRAAVAKADELQPGLPLVAGGKSYGGRMTSQAQAISPLPGVRGLAFLAFPLHPAGRPSASRGEHLCDVHLPMLFLQGTRDALADLGQLLPFLERLGEHATLRLLQHADHAFHVPARSGLTHADVRSEIADTLATWIKAVFHAAAARHGQNATNRS